VIPTGALRNPPGMDVSAVSPVAAQGPGVQAVLHGGLQPGGSVVCKGVLEKVRDFWD